MEVYDLHGKNIEEAIELVEKVIGKIRLSQAESDIKIITGWGSIRKALVKYFAEHNIDYHFEWGNDGVIIVNVC